MNLFLHAKKPIERAKVSKTLKHLAPIRAQFGLEEKPSIPPRLDLSAQFEMVLRLKPALFSTTLNAPSKEMVEACKKQGIKVQATATTLDEALYLEELNVDVITLQGIEAGGHRGTFLHPIEEAQVGLFALLQLCKPRLKTPVLAAGGIMDKAGVAAALSLGASGVQMGTAFLTTHEAGTPKTHRDMLLNSHRPTILSPVYTGRHARGIKNALYAHNLPLAGKTPDFDTMNALTRDIRKASSDENNPEYMSLWAGQSYRQCKEQSVQQLVSSLFA